MNLLRFNLDRFDIHEKAGYSAMKKWNITSVHGKDKVDVRGIRKYGIIK